MKSFFILSLILHTVIQASGQQTDYTRYVNTFIGTQGTGHTFPGPCLPFGLVQPGPDNVDQGWDYTSGYQYSDSLILGFSQTRANGTGISEFGDVLLQPFVGRSNGKFAARYQKSSEQASPGYYTVTMNNGIKVELTATSRVALHQYYYPSNNARLLVDLQHGLRFLTDSLVLESDVVVENNRSISGYCHTNNWVNRKYFFAIVFSKPFDSATLQPRSPKEAAPRYVLDFILPDQLLQVKVALSTVGVDGAKKNLQAELPGWDFGEVVRSAKMAWNKYLGRIDIEAPEKQKVIFYSAMYRLFIQPSNIVDVDGRYRGANDSVRTAMNKEYYSTLSLWDTYRAAHPLYTLLVPERVNGFVQTLITHSKAAGFLPIWSAWGKDNYCMIGNHAIPVITDAYLKGFDGFNAKEALKEMVRSTTVNHINSNWTLLNRYGYYPFDSLDNESVSRTLEHGVDDHYISRMAEAMGEKAIADTYNKRARYYKHLYDPSTRQMRGKDSKGRWRQGFDPLMATSPMNNPGDYTEANAWQYFWTPAQYDVQGMVQLLGGKKQFTEQLDSFFSIRAHATNKHLGQEAMIGQYAHGNEPSHHVAYLYAYSDKPWRGREIIATICRDFYNDTPAGMIGNDDCGQMSAWYIFSTLGFYPVDPGSGQFVLGLPQVKKATIHLEGGKTFTVVNKTDNATEPLLVRLNNKSYSHQSISYKQLIGGGSLVFGKSN
jgi:predicted alpha-1,2-mannosidase